MADRFGRELLTPVETAARAYREAKAKGLTGKAMQEYVRKQMSDPGSAAFRSARESVEDPPGGGAASDAAECSALHDLPHLKTKQ